MGNRNHPCGLTGRYVYIRYPHRYDYLTLCEVKVWGQAPAGVPIQQYDLPLSLETCSEDKKNVENLQMRADATKSAVKVFPLAGCSESDNVVQDDVPESFVLEQYETGISEEKSSSVKSVLVPPGKAV